MYAEALNGKRKAQRGLSRIVGTPIDSWEQNAVAKIDSRLLNSTHPTSNDPKADKKSTPPSALPDHLNSQPLQTLLRQRTTLFTHAVALASKAFIERIDTFNRKATAKPVRQCSDPLFIIHYTHPKPPSTAPTSKA